MFLYGLYRNICLKDDNEKLVSLMLYFNYRTKIRKVWMTTFQIFFSLMPFDKICSSKVTMFVILNSEVAASDGNAYRTNRKYNNRRENMNWKWQAEKIPFFRAGQRMFKLHFFLLHIHVCFFYVLETLSISKKSDVL